MKFKLLLLASLLVYSCNNSDNEFISLYSFLPEDSSVIVNINNLNNTKEILDNNELLPSVLSSTHEISAQLNLLSRNVDYISKAYPQKTLSPQFYVTLNKVVIIFLLVNFCLDL